MRFGGFCRERRTRRRRLAETYYNGAKAHERAGRREESKVGFRKALPLFEKVIATTRFDPVFTPDAYYMLAVAQSRLGDYGKAIELHRMIVDNWPEHHLAWSSQYWMGTFYQEISGSGAFSGGCGCEERRGVPGAV